MTFVKDIRAAVFGGLVFAIVWSTPDRVQARSKPGLVQGRILVDRSKLECPTPRKAYWQFTVPNVTPPSCRPRMTGYLVTLDEWDPQTAKRMMRKATRGGATPTVRIFGVDFVPSILIVPKEGQSYKVVFNNQDRFIHEIYSPDRPENSGEIVAPDGSASLDFDGLVPLQTGEVQGFRLRCRRFPHMKGLVLFVRSTALARVDGSGRFRIRVGQGRHMLRVWYEGKKIAERSIDVGRRTPDVTIDLRRHKRARKRAARPKNRKAARPRRRRRRGRHHRRRRRRH